METNIGESLMESWLRYEKECHVIQKNWRLSKKWKLRHEEELKIIQDSIETYFQHEFQKEYDNLPDGEFSVFKNNATLKQVLSQGELDALGIKFKDNDEQFFYAVEIAYHSCGLNYGDAKVTAMKVIEKMARAAMSLYGYLNVTQGEIIFATPLIYKGKLNILVPAIKKLEKIFNENSKLCFSFRLYSNDAFYEEFLEELLCGIDKGEYKNSTEDFMRAQQLVSIFKKKNNGVTVVTEAPDISSGVEDFKKLKIGNLANTELRNKLISASVDRNEIELMQTKDYSKKVFGLNKPLLLKAVEEKHPKGYYAEPLRINNEDYYMCNDWYERYRDLLDKWLTHH